MAGPKEEIPTLAEVLTQVPLDQARKIVSGLSRSGGLSLADMLDGVSHERAEEIRASLPRVTGAAGAEREVPTQGELRSAVSKLPPEQAHQIMARARPRPLAPPPGPGVPPAVLYSSWEDYLAKTTPADRRRWCAAKAAKANGFRLMSGRPETRISAEDVLAVLQEASGQCAYCGSLAVERRPLGPWGHVGRRIGSLGHRIARFNGGANTRANLAWCCMWCNTWPEERIRGAPTTAVTSLVSKESMADASNRRSFGAAVSVRQHAVRAAPSSVICAPSARRRGCPLAHMPNSGLCRRAYSCVASHIRSKLYGRVNRRLDSVISLSRQAERRYSGALLACPRRRFSRRVGSLWTRSLEPRP